MKHEAQNRQQLIQYNNPFISNMEFRILKKNTILQKYSFFFMVLFLAIVKSSLAQDKDSIEKMKEFISVCNDYKQLPLQLELQFQQRANILTQEGDTLTAKAQFYLQKEGTYIQFGELEQIVTDSTALMISQNLKRMLVLSNHQGVNAQMASYMGVMVSPAMRKQMSNRYRIRSGTAEDKEGILQLESRIMLAGSNVPKEEIRAYYKKESHYPDSIIQIKRNLVVLDSLSYTSYLSNPMFSGRLLQIPDAGYFLIKEKTVTYMFIRIDHQAGTELPVRIKDRIRKREDGSFEPMPLYQDYLLSQN